LAGMQAGGYLSSGVSAARSAAEGRGVEGPADGDEGAGAEGVRERDAIIRPRSDEDVMVASSSGDTEALLNDFAIRCFRDEADQDYIAARMAFRAGLDANSLWQSLQTVEKYLKCILLLNRIPAKKVFHDLGKAINLIRSSHKVPFEISPRTNNFIERTDEIGRFRYLEVSRIWSNRDLFNLDRAVWELRRYCTFSDAPRLLKLQKGVTPPKYRIPGGDLEEVIDNASNPAREPLLWNNAFFGKRQRRWVGMKTRFKAVNAPLFLNPQLLDEILKYIHLPQDVINGYRSHPKSE